MTHAPGAWDIDGPVQAEVFTIWLHDGVLELTGPCGADPWLIELGETEHPVAVVDRIVRDVIGEPMLVHSTSWRRERAAIILTFVVAVTPDLVSGMASRAVRRTELARSEATVAPRDIAADQVVEHALRHLAWLAEDDPVVRAELPGDWHAALAGYAPEPFRNLG